MTMAVRWRRTALFTLFLVLLLLIGSVHADESKKEAKADSKSKKEKETKESKEAKTEEKIDDSFDVDNTDWGTYYDPKDIFCGKFDCYKILGFDYENYGEPSKKQITQRYRKLSRAWHPDKSKHKNAKARFVKIARAYEVLTNQQVRAEYDKMRYDQEAYVSKYGTSVLWSYAPKTDVTLVVVLILLIANVVAWYIQQNRWQMVADRLVKAAVEDWSPSQGGTVESKQIREEAMAELQAEQNKENGSPTKKKPKKVAGKSRKKLQQEALYPIIQKKVYAMNDFGAGFHKPTLKDLLLVSIAKFPLTVGKEILWQSQYYTRRLQGKELDEHEKEILTARAVGPAVWDTSAEDVRKIMMQRELWILDNLVEWNEEQEIKNLPASERKMLKKKGKLD